MLAQPSHQKNNNNWKLLITFKIALRSKGKQNEYYKLYRSIESVRRRAWGYTYSVTSKQYFKKERLKIVELSFQLVLQTLRKLGQKYLTLYRVK